MPSGAGSTAAVVASQPPPAGSSSPSSSMVLRLLVFHLDLPTLCTGRDLDESASDEELAESVLFYYCSRTGTWLEGDNGEADRPAGPTAGELRECVRFSGLCQALFRLPGALQRVGSEEGNDAQEVHLGRSLLVFEVLEAPHVVAVAQVSRQPGSPSPRAVRAALRRSHHLFCLFRGGGILPRLGDYGRMRTLYEWQRHRRNLVHKRPELDESSDVTALRLGLPITSLREDLKIHYDTLLEDLALSAAEGTGAGRSIVECVPTPVRLPTGAFSSDVAPAPFPSSLANVINAKVKEFLIDQAQKADSASRVVAVSSFENGTLVRTVVSNDTSVSDESAVLLFTHMSILHSKMSSSLDRGESGLPATNRGYTPLSVTFGKDMVQDATTNATTVPCRFMAPPPLALLSASDDEAHDFQGPLEGTRVWAPRVSLPQRTGPPMVVRVTLYERDHYAFLLYIDCPRCDEEEDRKDTVLSECMRRFDEMASSALTLQVVDQLPAMTDSSNHSGLDVILIRRPNLAITLLRNPNNEKSNESNNPSTLQKGRLRFFKSKFYTDRSAQQPHQSALGDRALDPRYQLASTLSSESLVAFEDAILEVRKERALGNDEWEVEACTLLPSKWMYAFSDGTHELFVFLDPAIYVTVNDVQHAAERIRSDLIETIRVETL